MVKVTRISEKKSKSSGNSLQENVQLPLLAPHETLFSRMTDGFAYFRVLLDENQNPMDYVFLDLNKAYRRLSGLGDKCVVGKKASEVFVNPKDEAFDCIKTCSEVALTGRNITFDARCSNLDRWFVVNAYCPQKGYFAMIVKDITGRRKIENALRQSEKQYKKLANSITDPFFALDSSLRFVYWNKASEVFTGIKSADAIGKHFYEVFGRDKNTRKTVHIYWDVMRQKKSRTYTEILPRGDANTIFDIEVYPTGNGISVLAKDITERKKLQNALEEYAKRLEELVRIRTEKLQNAERLAAIGETAGMVGHDIRNPLQSIISELYLAKDDLKDLQDCEAKKNLEAGIHSIEEQTHYINKIVTDLQDYAKPMTPSNEDVNLEGIILDVISTLDTPANVNILYSIEKPFPLLRTDPFFIKRILTNLTLNGIQAMQQKGGKISINVFQRAKTVFFAVSDTGTGIPEEAQEKLFKPLFTTKSKGQGFGLAVVKKLVEALGGSISFETKSGKGTTFIIELPLNE